MIFIQKIRGRFNAVLRFIQEMNKKQKTVAFIVVLFLFTVAVFSGGKDIRETPVNETREVTLINVGQSSTESTPLSVTGSVRSKSEAVLKTESQGEVIGVYRTVGQFVVAGTVIAELRNASERAAVLQAQAGLEAAQANLTKGTGGVRNEDRTVLEISLANAEDSFNSAKTSIRNTLRSAYASVDDVIIGSADSLFSNPNSINPVFNLATSKSAVVTGLVQSRIQIQKILERQSETSLTLETNEDLIFEINVTEEEMKVVRNFLDDALSVINSAIPTTSIPEATVTVLKTDITAARSLIAGTLASLTNARNMLNNSEAAFDIAKQNLDRGVTGAQAEDVTALKAVVKQAEASLSLARANLSRTLIVTPISGTINTLNLRAGDFVSAFSSAAIVSNNSALEVTSYVTVDDKDNIRVGGKALIDGQYDGVVTSVSPGLDPVTKRIEVRIGVVGANTTLTNGSSVRLSIERNHFEINPVDITELAIPISALKIETNRVIVFTINDDNKLVAHEVTTGLVLGDSLQIEDGLTPDMNIVADARGLREGQVVVLANTN